MYNYRIYGNQLDKGWIKITTIEKEKHIKVVLDDMAQTEQFTQYIIIRHNFEMKCDEPYDIGNFDNAIKKYYKLK